MKRPFIAFLLAILICFCALTSCKKNAKEQETQDAATEKITEEQTEQSTTPIEDETVDEEDQNEPEQKPEPEPEKFVMDYAVSDRVYSCYGSDYGMICTALNKYGMPLDISVFGLDLIPDRSHSFCEMQYNEDGKLTSLVFSKDSVIHEKLFDTDEKLTFEVTRYDKKGRPLKTKPVNFATISFEYDDDANTSSMIFTHVYLVGSYTLTFDEYGRILTVDDFGNWHKNEYTDSVATHTEKEFEDGEKYELSYDSLTLTELSTSDGRFKYTYNELGFGALVDATDSDGNTSRKAITYDQKNRMVKLEDFTVSGAEATKNCEYTWAYDLYDKITEYQEFFPNDDGEFILTNAERYAYTATGNLEAYIFITYGEDGIPTVESVVAYNADGSYMQTNTTYDGYRTEISEMVEYDVLGRPTHVFTSKFDVNNHEAATVTTIYNYSNTDGNYSKTVCEYSYSDLLAQTTESYIDNVLRQKEVISYDEDMNISDTVITYYDKDGNEIV